MKNLFALAIILLVAHHLKAQHINKHFNYDYKPDNIRYEPIEYYPVQPVQMITFSVIKAKEMEIFKKEFNKTGKLTGFYETDDKGEVRPLWKFQYDAQDRLVKTERFEKGKLQYATVHGYNEKGEPLTQEKTDIKREVRRLKANC